MHTIYCGCEGKGKDSLLPVFQFGHLYAEHEINNSTESIKQ